MGLEGMRPAEAWGLTTAQMDSDPLCSSRVPGVLGGLGQNTGTQSPGEQGMWGLCCDAIQPGTVKQSSRAPVPGIRALPPAISKRTQGDGQDARGKKSQTTDSVGEGGPLYNHVSPRREGIHLGTHRALGENQEAEFCRRRTVSGVQKGTA